MANLLNSKTGINIASKDKKSLFKTEILEGLNWLTNAYDDINKGWGALPGIPVAVQNTSEIIYTFISCYEYLNEEQIEVLKEVINAWLEDITVGDKFLIDYYWILITLVQIRNHIQMFSEELRAKIENEIINCLGYFFTSQNSDGGWGTGKGEISSTIRTSMVLIAISQVVFEPTDYQREAVDKAVKWLLKEQNTNGGWGNIDKNDIDNDFIRKINLTYQQLELQYIPNPCTTAYAMKALKAIKPHAYKSQLNKAADYLIKEQKETGEWELYTEFLLRRGVKTSFRHLSTTVCIDALLKTYSIDYSSEVLIKSIDFLVSLQDPVYKGWKCTATSESYSWSTCNALICFGEIKYHFDNIRASEFMSIIREWWMLKNDKDISVFKFGNITLSFNKTLGFITSSAITLLLLTWAVLALMVFTGEGKTNVMAPIIVTLLTIVMGIPWTIYVKLSYKEMQDSWFETIGWVYGIVVGVLLAFYGFFF